LNCVRCVYEKYRERAKEKKREERKGERERDEASMAIKVALGDMRI
jgi:hypothetical protein